MDMINYSKFYGLGHRWQTIHSWMRSAPKICLRMEKGGTMIRDTTQFLTFVSIMSVRSRHFVTVFE